MWSSFEAKFDGLKNDFESHVRLLETYAQLASAQRQKEFIRSQERRDVLEDEEVLRCREREKQLKLIESVRLQSTFSSSFSFFLRPLAI